MCKFTWGYKVKSFSKFESPKVKVNKYVVTNCSTGYKTGQKKTLFHFPKDQQLKQKLIYSVNRKDW